MAFAVPVWLAVQEEMLGSFEPEEEQDGAPPCFDNFSDEALFEKFHLSRPCIAFILDSVGTHMKTVDSTKRHTSVDVMLMIALNYYAHGAFSSSVAGNTWMSQTGNLNSVVKTISGVLAAMCKTFISFPLTAEARSRTASQIEEFCGIPNVLGVLAPAHFKIRASPYDKTSFKSFINALGYTSVVSQFICDSEGNILSVEKCCVGSSFEQEMWETSFKGKEVENEQHGPFWFIGGKGYHLSKHVLTPVLEPSTDGDIRFNKAHAKIHNVMEVTIGSMKRRFKCLMQLGFADETSLNTKANIIKACCMLHNIAKKFSVPLPGNNTAAVHETPYPGKQHLSPVEVSTEALEVRRQLIEKNFSVAKHPDPVETSVSK
ncbi:putative nuclease HARBI1 [Nothobranchius furzeri]|uniref:Harbinger transposase derived 1 n=3 Tax=Nothobranchius furzeri TaxID=105023 RepID=A0A1A8V5N0_NOTFU|nr:putative nuclease HARBI1 [Nothobranchius furzeri]KAF7204532.1 putative nuclease HARBI1 [Nothobranchius furzeri]